MYKSYFVLCFYMTKQKSDRLIFERHKLNTKIQKSSAKEYDKDTVKLKVVSFAIEFI